MCDERLHKVPGSIIIPDNCVSSAGVPNEIQRDTTQFDLNTTSRHRTTLGGSPHLSMQGKGTSDVSCVLDCLTERT